MSRVRRDHGLPCSPERPPASLTVAQPVVPTAGLAGFHPSERRPLTGAQKLWQGEKIPSRDIRGAETMNGNRSTPEGDGIVSGMRDWQVRSLGNRLHSDDSVSERFPSPVREQVADFSSFIAEIGPMSLHLVRYPG